MLPCQTQTYFNSILNASLIQQFQEDCFVSRWSRQQTVSSQREFSDQGYQQNITQDYTQKNQFQDVTQQKLNLLVLNILNGDLFVGSKYWEKTNQRMEMRTNSRGLQNQNKSQLNFIEVEMKILLENQEEEITNLSLEYDAESQWFNMEYGQLEKCLSSNQD